MKKLVIIAVLIVAAAGVKAQDCEAIMLPYFGGNMERMAAYRDKAPQKYMYRCVYAQSAFYESDTVPAGAEVLDITKVVEWSTGRTLPRNYVIDLNTFSYYAYNFSQIQVRHDSVTERTYFSTPGSRHPYLVLRSVNEMTAAAEEYLQEAFSNVDNNRK